MSATNTATTTATTPAKQPKPLPAPNSDFYELADTLDSEELALLKQVRAFMEAKVAPIINKYWIEDSFPFELLPVIQELNLGGLGMQGYGCRGGSALLFGLAAMEMSRVQLVDRDLLRRPQRPGHGLHLRRGIGGAEAEVAAADGSLREDRLFRPDRAARGFRSEPRSDDDGEARGGHLGPQRPEEVDRQFALVRPLDHLARDVADNQVKGFIVENKTTPGFSVEKIQNKIALKVVQNGLITLKDVRVPEENHLQEGKSFRDTARVLRMTRYLVAWEATGCQMGAYEHAVRYAQERLQFGKPIGSFQLIQDLLARMLANVTACQCLVVRSAQLHAEGKLGDHHAALSKAFCTSKMRETVSWAREIFGGNGITTDYDVARFFADAEALYSYEGTYQMQNLIVGKAITGFSAFV